MLIDERTRRWILEGKAFVAERKKGKEKWKLREATPHHQKQNQCGKQLVLAVLGEPLHSFLEKVPYKYSNERMNELDI